MKKILSYVAAIATMAISTPIVSQALQAAPRRATLTLTNKRPTEVTIYQSRSIDGLRSVDTDTMTVGPRSTVQIDIETGGAWPYLIFTREIVEGKKNARPEELSLIVQPGDRISAAINDTTGFTLDETSNNYKGQLLYDSLYHARDMTPHLWTSEPFESFPDEMFATYGKASDTEMTLLKALHKSGDIDRRFLRQAMLDTEYYYALVMAYLVVKNANQVAMGIIYYKKQFPPQVWNKIYARHPVDRHSLRTTWAPQYAQYYSIVNDRVQVKWSHASRPDFDTREQSEIYFLDKYKETLKKESRKMRDALIATQIWKLSEYEIFGATTMDSLARDHAAQFSKSPYNRYLARFRHDVSTDPNK